jgi:hypothetical protein
MAYFQGVLRTQKQVFYLAGLSRRYMWVEIEYELKPKA